MIRPSADFLCCLNGPYSSIDTILLWRLVPDISEAAAIRDVGLSKRSLESVVVARSVVRVKIKKVADIPCLNLFSFLFLRKTSRRWLVAVIFEGVAVGIAEIDCVLAASTFDLDFVFFKRFLYFC